MMPRNHWTAAVLTAGVATFVTHAFAAPPQTRTNPKDNLTYVWVAPGSFTMGCPEGDKACADAEKPARTVSITKGFWTGQTEVTVRAYKRFSQATGQKLPDEPNFRGRVLNPSWSNEDLPIVGVTWGEAKSYCEWTGGRLPTAAEWEYAARGGMTSALYGDVSRIAWNADNSGKPIDSAKALHERAGGDGRKMLDVLKENENTMHRVGQKEPNAYGLLDTIGNVLEWVSDWEAAGVAAPSTPADDPQGPLAGERKGTRGGSWITSPDRMRVTSRTSSTLDYRSNYLGLRCVQN